MKCMNLAATLVWYASIVMAKHDVARVRDSRSAPGGNSVGDGGGGGCKLRL